jgi:hypothetical protein
METGLAHCYSTNPALISSGPLGREPLDSTCALSPYSNRVTSLDAVGLLLTAAPGSGSPLTVPTPPTFSPLA